MAKQDYIPDRDPQFLTWHDNFKTQVAALKATFGLTEAEVTTVADDNAAIHAKVSAADTARAAAQTATQEKNTTRREVERNTRSLAQKLKAHASYTEAVGSQLGIIGPEDTTDLTTARPTLTLDDRQPHRIVIGFNKSVSDGVNLYGKRPGEAAFTFLARDTESPYVDTRPCSGNTPEQRQYYAVYVLHDEEIGMQSDLAQAVCQP